MPRARLATENMVGSSLNFFLPTHFTECCGTWCFWWKSRVDSLGAFCLNHPVPVSFDFCYLTQLHSSPRSHLHLCMESPVRWRPDQHPHRLTWFPPVNHHVQEVGPQRAPRASPSGAARLQRHHIKTFRGVAEVTVCLARLIHSDVAKSESRQGCKPECGLLWCEHLLSARLGWKGFVIDALLTTVNYGKKK